LNCSRVKISDEYALHAAALLAKKALVQMGGHNFTPAAGEVILKRGQWQTLFTWAGFNPFGFLIWGVHIQEEFREFPIEWRRYGVGFPPYWEGEFRGETEFSIKPAIDPFIRVDLRSGLADVGVNITHRTTGLVLIDK